MQKSAAPRFQSISESAFFAAAAALVFLLKWLVLGRQAVSGDGVAYLTMANGGVVEPPQSFHILTPWLAALISPSEPASGFIWIAAVSFVGTAVCTGLIVRQVVADSTFAERSLGVALFIATGTGVMMFRFCYFTDSLSYFLLAAACLAILYRIDWLFAVLTLIGIFNRETSLFALPVWLILNLGRDSWLVLIRRALWVTAPAAFGYFLLHNTTLIFGYLPPHLNYLLPENMLLLWRISLSWLGNDNVYLGLAICVFLAFGPVWLLAAYGVFDASKRSRWSSNRAFFALFGLAIPVIGTLMIVDWRRGFQPLFPLIIVAAIFGIRAFSGANLVSRWIISISAVASATICAESWWFPPMRISVGVAMAGWTVAVCAALAIARSERSIELSPATAGE